MQEHLFLDSNVESTASIVARDSNAQAVENTIINATTLNLIVHQYKYYYYTINLIENE